MSFYKKKGSFWLNYNGSPTFLGTFTVITLIVTAVWFGFKSISWLVENTKYGGEIVTILLIIFVTSILIWASHE